jgi:hypothetical protein
VEDGKQRGAHPETQRQPGVWVGLLPRGKFSDFPLQERGSDILIERFRRGRGKAIKMGAQFVADLQKLNADIL